jgi:hypothetical protein
MSDEFQYGRLDTYPLIDQDLSWAVALYTFKHEFTQEQRDAVLEIFTKANMEIPDAR